MIDCVDIFRVPGKPEPRLAKDEGALVLKGNRTFRIDRLEETSSGSEILLSFSALDEMGNHLPLRPVMGAFAHLVAFESTTNGFAHLHPLEYEPPNASDDLRKGSLLFSFKSPNQGDYRLWAQIKVADDAEETFLAFDLSI